MDRQREETKMNEDRRHRLARCEETVRKGMLIITHHTISDGQCNLDYPVQ